MTFKGEEIPFLTRLRKLVHHYNLCRRFQSKCFDTESKPSGIINEVYKEIRGNAKGIQHLSDSNTYFVVSTRTLITKLLFDISLCSLHHFLFKIFKHISSWNIYERSKDIYSQIASQRFVGVPVQLMLFQVENIFRERNRVSQRCNSDKTWERGWGFL